MLKDRALLVKEQPLTHAVGVHDRCGTVDEPLVMKQWWVRMPPLAAPAIQAVRDGRITIYPRYQEKVYFNWMENIRDWPVSRQIWWGHSIPVWYCRDCDEIIVPAEDAADPTRCTRCRSDDIYQDPDVLDTWFSSALWPHSTLGWPDQTPGLRRYYPGSVLETGYDILFFWVARMIMMGTENMGDIPFHTVYLHGLVLTGGEKMSKSKGNAVSPVGLIEEYGADALRFALVNGVAAGADQTLSETKLQNAKEFANKLWNISRFVLHHVDANAEALRDWRADRTPAPAAGAGSTDPSLGHAERWILSRTEATAAELTRLLEHYLFGEYASALQQFVWSEFADVYVELAKAGLRDGGTRAAGTVRTLAYVLDRVLRLAHPIVPFISDTIAVQLWQRLPNADRSPSLVIAKWPKPGTRSVALEERMEIALELVRTIRNLRQEAGTKPGERVKTTLGGDTTAIHDLADLISHLAQTEVTFGSGTGQAAVVRAIEVRVAVERDPAEHRARLEKELAEAKEQLRRSRELLARPGFAEKAPPNVVANERAKLAEREERARLLEEELRRGT
jgi:valyl-tRNA synthetase